jgi:putative transposase
LIVHRELPESQVSQVCVKLNPSGRIHAIFLVEEAETQVQASKEPRKAVGVDLGITRLATLSDGRFLGNPKPLERSLERIRVLQRTLSRKKFLSKNWLKTKRRLAKQHEHVGDFRRDLFFNRGVLLSQEYDVLVLEDLNVQGLIQKGVTKKRRLRLYDSSFSELRGCLEWEFLKRGKTVLAVSAYNTSRECFLCGRINQNLSLEDRVFHCPYCSFTLDRDLNASLVLLKRAGWVPPGVPAVELRPIPPLPSLGLKKRRQGGVMKQEAPAIRRGSSRETVLLKEHTAMA